MRNGGAPGGNAAATRNVENSQRGHSRAMSARMEPGEFDDLGDAKLRRPAPVTVAGGA